METRKQLLTSIICLSLVVLGLSSCGKDSKSFENSSDAITACRNELYKLMDIKECSTEKLSRIFLNWNELQNSAISALLRDSIDIIGLQNSNHFYNINDSIIVELKRLSLEQKRSLEDLVTFKALTAKGKKELQESENYLNARDFYKKISVRHEVTAEQSIADYMRLLDTTKPFKKEGDMMTFFQKEEACYQAVLANLSTVNEDSLEVISKKTESILKGLNAIAMSTADDPVTKRVIAYMNVRITHRVMANSLQCMNDIDKGIKMDQNTAEGYRWMLLQPFMTIDQYSMAYMSDEQIDILRTIARKMPEMTKKINAMAGVKEEQQDGGDNKDLSDILVGYLWKLTISQFI